MQRTLALNGSALLALLLAAACQPQMQRSGVGQNYGDQREQQLRAVEMQGIRSGTNPGVQNPVVTGVNPGTTGIERAPTGGTGTAGTQRPIMGVRPDGSGSQSVDRGPGVGAPTR
ncbi:MAG TPA: hypothetical protein VEX11_07980 [Acetobacteraceae bacterium]|jgi:hypothetical protein|nr:hypothetical protein [Acetobacteraceae bacterium]